MINKCLLFMQSLVFPEVCVFCRSTEHCAAGICQSCYSQLPWAVQGCPICALSIGTDLICGACINNQPSFDASIAVFNYKEPITNGIHALKFHHQFCFSRTFSITLARLISGLDLEPRPDAILAVPAHSKRLRIRGFNQATEIATTLSRILSIPMLDNTLFRTNENSPQRTLTKTQRLSNLKNAFHLSNRISASRVAVVDDVMTTGSTLESIAQTLKSGGVEHVQNWVIARA